MQEARIIGFCLIDLPEFLEFRECLPDLVAELDVAVMDRVEDEEFHLPHIWQPVLREVLLVHPDCEDVPDEEEACACSGRSSWPPGTQASSGNR